MAAELAEGLRARHAGGALHGAVDPSTVLLTTAGPLLTASVSPGGPGQSVQAADETVNEAPGFLAPEQLASHDVGPAADIYSLGAVLVFALTGEPPAIQGRASAQQGAGVPAGLRHVLEWCLASQPGDRPTPDELVTALGPLDASTGSWLPDSALAVLPGNLRAGNAIGELSAIEPPWPLSARLFCGLWCVGVAAIAMAIAIVAVVQASSRPPSPASGPLTFSRVTGAGPIGCSQFDWMLASGQGGAPVSFTFVNDSSSSIMVWLLDFLGDESLKSTVAPGQAYKTNAATAQIWMVSTATETCVRFFDVMGDGEVVVT
jgi:hypothetical protein